MYYYGRQKGRLLPGDSGTYQLEKPGYELVLKDVKSNLILLTNLFNHTIPTLWQGS